MLDKLKFVVDQLSSLGEIADASEGISFSRELEHVRTEVLKVQYAENKAFSFLPMDTEIRPEDEAWTARKLDMVGSAVLASDYSDNGPESNVKMEEESPTYFRPIKGMYKFSFQEARVAAKLNRPLAQWKAEACRRAVADVLDNVLLMGDGTAAFFKLYGLFKLSGAATYATPNGLSGLKTWANKTALEVYADLTDSVTQMTVDTKEKMPATRMILPLSSERHIANRPWGVDSGKSILQYFREQNPQIDIRTSVKLETAGAAGVKRSVIYRATPDVLQAGVPTEFEQLAPQVEGYHVVTRCHARVGGVRMWQPLAVEYMDGI